MLGAFARLGVGALGAFAVALILEKLLGVMLTIMADAPNGTSSDIYGWTASVQENFYLLALIGLLVAFLVEAHVESRIGGA